MEQLGHNHPLRERIDKIILKVLGFREGKIEKLLGYFYPALYREIL